MAEVSRECGLEVVVDDYVETFKPFLMDIMYSWSKGASFRDICLMTGEMGARRGRNGGRRGGSRAGTRAYPEYSVSSLRLVPSPASFPPLRYLRGQHHSRHAALGRADAATDCGGQGGG